MRLIKTIFLFVIIGLFSLLSVAQNLKATLGQVNQLQVKLENQKAEKCNIDVAFPNGGTAQFEVSKPDYIANIAFNPATEGQNTITWQGNLRRRGLSSLTGCEGNGKFSVYVTPNNEIKAQRWSELVSKVSEKQKTCISTGLKLVNGNLDFNAISGDINVDVNEPIVKEIRNRCESYADAVLQKNQACKINEHQSGCDEVYEITINGEKKQFFENEILTYVFKKESIQKVTFENAESKVKRELVEAEEAKKLEAYKKTPAYKKEQAELAKKQAAEEAAAKKLAIEAEKLRAKEEAEAKKQKDIEVKRLAELKAKEDAVPFRLLFLCMDSNGYGYDLQYAQGLVTYFIPDPGLDMNLRIRSGLKSTNGNCQPTDGNLTPSSVDMQSLKLVRERDGRSYYILKVNKFNTYGVVRP